MGSLKGWVQFKKGWVQLIRIYKTLIFCQIRYSIKTLFVGIEECFTVQMLSVETSAGCQYSYKAELIFTTQVSTDIHYTGQH